MLCFVSDRDDVQNEVNMHKTQKETHNIVQVIVTSLDTYPILINMFFFFVCQSRTKVQQPSTEQALFTQWRQSRHKSSTRNYEKIF